MMHDEEKQCSKCKVHKPLSNYWKGGYSCIDCSKEYHKNYNETSKRKINKKGNDAKRQENIAIKQVGVNELQCGTCKIIKPVDDFPGKKMKFTQRCKQCAKEYSQLTDVKLAKNLAQRIWRAKKRERELANPTSISEKKCCYCKEIKPISEFHGKIEKSTSCKTCTSVRSKIYAAKVQLDPVKRQAKLIRQATYYKLNTNKYSDYQQQYYNDNKSEIKGRTKKYQNDNKDKVREWKRKNSEKSSISIDDAYTRKLVKREYGNDIHELMPQFIELKRCEILSYRIKRQLNKK